MPCFLLILENYFRHRMLTLMYSEIGSKILSGYTVIAVKSAELGITVFIGCKLCFGVPYLVYQLFKPYTRLFRG